MKAHSGSVALLFLAIGLVAAVHGAVYTNPVVLPNAPDPGVLFYKGTYYAVTTSGDVPNHYPIRLSTDLVHWKLAGYVFPNTSSTGPRWAVQDYWAPELHLVNGKLVVYFTARDTAGVLCIGAAVSTSDSPLGPYRDIGHPLIKNGTMGSIDATFFLYRNPQGQFEPMLYWKNDGNAVGLTTYIWVQQLNADGLSFKPGTTPQALIHNDLPWEQGVVEGPWVIFRRGFFYLFYSGNGYEALSKDGTCKYAVGVARSSHPRGPFVKNGLPILHSATGDAFTGPGHCSVVPFPGDHADEYYMVYHAWSMGGVGGNNPRHMLVDKISWQSNGWPVVYKGFPSDTPQPVP